MLKSVFSKFTVNSSFNTCLLQMQIATHDSSMLLCTRDEDFLYPENILHRQFFNKRMFKNGLETKHKFTCVREEHSDFFFSLILIKF